MALTRPRLMLVPCLYEKTARELSSTGAHARLASIEDGLFRHLESAGEELHGAELRLAASLDAIQRSRHLRDRETIDVPLHPLPLTAIDKAVGATLRSELAWTQQQLNSTRRELRDCARSKAYRYELAYMRNELHAFLSSINERFTAATYAMPSEYDLS